VVSLVERFAEALAANGGSVHGPFPVEVAVERAVALALERAEGMPVAVASGDELVRRLGLPARLEAAGATVLLPGDPEWRERIGGAGAGVTGATCGLAATGTVAVTCGPDSPRATSLVPPSHVCLVRASDVVEDLAEALLRLTSLPSALAWISGPSRSADLEMTLTVGVHGPASVEVIVVEER
jgi:L-lactate dehydrogenase complex protein LldG